MVTDYETYFKTYWSAKLGSLDLWEKALQDGVVEPATMPVGGVSFSGAKLGEAAAAAASAKGGAVEVVFYQKVSIGHGRAHHSVVIPGYFRNRIW